MGRTRQPYCPDCLRAGIEVLKEKGGGYCGPCRRLRQLAYREADEESTDPIGDYRAARIKELDARIKELEELVELLRVANERMIDQDFSAEKANYLDRIAAVRKETTQIRTAFWVHQELLHEENPDRWEHPLVKPLWGPNT